MKVMDIVEIVTITHELEVEIDGKTEYFTRHDDGEWTFEVSYDIFGETMGVEDEKAEKLENLFQRYKEFIRKI